MSRRLFLLLSFVLAFVQGVFLPQVFAEGILLIFLLLLRPGFRSAPYVFVAGLIFDLVQNQTLGITSAIFLVALFLFNLSFEWFQVQKAPSLAFFSALICALRWKISFGYLPYLEIFVSFVFAFVLLNIFWRPGLQGKIRV